MDDRRSCVKLGKLPPDLFGNVRDQVPAVAILLDHVEKLGDVSIHDWIRVVLLGRLGEHMFLVKFLLQLLVEIEHFFCFFSRN